MPIAYQTHHCHCKNPPSTASISTFKTSYNYNNHAFVRHFLTNKYCISESDLESRDFLFRRTFSNPRFEPPRRGLCVLGVPKRDPEKVKLALENTGSLLWVQHKKIRKPVAFARTTGDGAFSAIIWDVVVEPSFQGIGLGRAVMERLVEELLENGIVNIVLYSAARVQGIDEMLI